MQMEIAEQQLKQQINDICRKLMITKDHCNILSYSKATAPGHGVNQYTTLNMDFYGGLPGLCYVLINYQTRFQDNIVLEIIDKLINTCAYYYKEERLAGRTGYYDGIAGYYFLLQYAANRLSDYRYKKNAEAIKPEFIKKLRSETTEVDIISGVAGIILNFSSPGNYILEDEILTICAKRLLETYKEYGPDTIVWADKDHKEPLGGLAHGTGGIALSLFRLYDITQNNHYQELGHKSLQYDIGLFDADKSDWPDKRFEKKAYSNGWCHGSPGLILPLLKASQLRKEETYTRYLNIAIDNTLNKLLSQTTWSLCHGLYGNAEILQYAAAHHEPRREAIQNKLQEMDQDQPAKLEARTNGYQNHEYHAGFMQGKSGICHYLLKQTGVFYSPIIFE